MVRGNQIRVNEVRRLSYRRRRDNVLAHYGYVCVCCGEGEARFIAVDHIIPGSEPKLRSEKFLNWIKRNNYPGGFQLLCHNCNHAKSSNEVCPHDELRLARPYQI